ncbi:exonuclease domain-containing protein [Micromonospora sp. NPDC005299]|uniref:exonuclease domain-containing protein n=1 Tax=Micromonospora sp. NPDC005299 TaxID=3364231 RepID=UPI00369AE05F
MGSWVAIDFETANEYRGSPCAVAMVAVQDGKVVERCNTYIQPPPAADYFSPFCVALHGITARHVENAPSWPQALKQIVEFVDGRPVVAHNAAFDLGVIRSACDLMDLPWPDLTYACTLVIARRTWQLISYSLPWVADAAGHQLLDHHDPAADAHAAAAIALAAQRIHGVEELPELLSATRIRFGALSGGEWNGCRYHAPSPSGARSSLPGANPDADPDGPFYGLSVCFTGTLLAMNRDEARHLVAEVGGQPVAGVSKKTDVLVIGEQDLRRFRPGAKTSSKHQKAAALLEAGHSIEVVSELDFLQRLAATEGVSLRTTQA